MKFSVVVPIYNVSVYLTECIESVLNQSFTDYELILVNDGSKDDSLSICRKYESAYPNRIIVVDKPNGGLVSARKAGAAVARGEFIVCLDGDDHLNVDLFSKLNAEVERNPQVDMICYGYTVDYGIKQSEPVLPPLKVGIYTNIAEISSNYFYNASSASDNSGCLLYSIWSKAVKREIYIKSQKLVPNTIKNGEDVLLTALILNETQNVSVIHYSGYFYRENIESMTHVRKPYDLVNVTNVKSEIENIGIYPLENIAHYYISSIWVLTHDFALQSQSYTEFISLIREYLQFDKKYKRVNFYRNLKSSSTKFKYKLIQWELWRFIYWYTKRKG
ncbi:MAG: glycosyltransferase [Clostridia bacterium]|nr:glycosyltransferase [Clostridia bacterium]